MHVNIHVSMCAYIYIEIYVNMYTCTSALAWPCSHMLRGPWPAAPPSDKAAGRLGRAHGPRRL